MAAKQTEQLNASLVTGGIGGQREELTILGGFIGMTGGSRMQRQGARNYSKLDHAANPDPVLPDMDISTVHRIISGI